MTSDCGNVTPLKLKSFVALVGSGVLAWSPGGDGEEVDFPLSCSVLFCVSCCCFLS